MPALVLSAPLVTTTLLSLSFFFFFFFFCNAELRTIGVHAFAVVMDNQLGGVALESRQAGWFDNSELQKHDRGDAFTHRVWDSGAHWARRVTAPGPAGFRHCRWSSPHDGSFGESHRHCPTLRQYPLKPRCCASNRAEDFVSLLSLFMLSLSASTRAPSLSVAICKEQFMLTRSRPHTCTRLPAHLQKSLIVLSLPALAPSRRTLTGPTVAARFTVSCRYCCAVEDN
jgi:hypothetical protein